MFLFQGGFCYACDDNLPEFSWSGKAAAATVECECSCEWKYDISLPSLETLAKSQAFECRSCRWWSWSDVSDWRLLSTKTMQNKNSCTVCNQQRWWSASSAPDGAKIVPPSGSIHQRGGCRLNSKQTSFESQKEREITWWEREYLEHSAFGLPYDKVKVSRESAPTTTIITVMRFDTLRGFAEKNTTVHPEQRGIQSELLFSILKVQFCILLVAVFDCFLFVGTLALFDFDL